LIAELTSAWRDLHACSRRRSIASRKFRQRVFPAAQALAQLLAASLLLVYSWHCRTGQQFFAIRSRQREPIDYSFSFSSAAGLVRQLRNRSTAEPPECPVGQLGTVEQVNSVRHSRSTASTYRLFVLFFRPHLDWVGSCGTSQQRREATRVSSWSTWHCRTGQQFFAIRSRQRERLGYSFSFSSAAGLGR
jgi:hypothetical protein